jgi:hypothetical protein
VSILLLLTDGLLGLLERSQSSAHSTGLLDTKIQGDELLLLVEETELFTLGLVDDGQDTGNVLAGLSNLLGTTTGHLLDTDFGKLLLLFVKNL